MFTVAHRDLVEMAYLSRTGRQSGFTYLLLLFAIALIGVALSTTTEVWSKSDERNKLKELDWVGGQYVKAIESYYYFGGVNRKFPKSLLELTLDGRSPFAIRHLREVYADPLTGKQDWLLIKAPDGGIAGVAVSIQIWGRIIYKEYVFGGVLSAISRISCDSAGPTAHPLHKGGGSS
jgi:type II secretory pathway pseudopilin PulG